MACRHDDVEASDTDFKLTTFDAMSQGPVSHEVTVESPEQSVPGPGSRTSQEDAATDPHAVPGAKQSQSTFA